MKKFLRYVVTRLIYRIRIRPTLNKIVPVKLRNISLTIYPSVFNPVFFRSSEFFPAYLDTLDLKDKKILDAGTGSGFLAICMARKGAYVTAVDLNPVAVECARKNAESNNVSIDVRQSNWFDALDDEMFDVVISNGPFIKGAPRPPFDIAMFAGEQNESAQKLIEGCAEHLAPGGFALFSISTESDIAWYMEQFAKRFVHVHVALQKKYFFEEYSIVKASRGKKT